MKYVNSDYRLHIKYWLDDIEDGANEQVINIANLPFTFHHIAVMPDAHQGYGMPIGGVMATEGVIVPNAVGVDIGCGMCAIRTILKAEDLGKGNLKIIMSLIRQRIPVGYKKHKYNHFEDMMPRLFSYPSHIGYIVKQEWDNAVISLGTLGGGNHFIEIQKDREDSIWIMIHSGSRNLGKKVADHYNKKARELNRKYYSIVGDEQQLAFLPIDTNAAKDYLLEMQYCVDFALANRKVMMDMVIKAIQEVLDYYWITEEKIINIAHNYVVMENHFGKNVMVHRKGATLVREGTIGIIPGSQGTKSYIVSGKGNRDSFNSCSHGAGRKMGRKQAQRELNLEREIEMLNSKGVIHSVRGIKNLDEAPSAYKDIGIVMENQKDLVDIVEELTPLAVIKG